MIHPDLMKNFLVHNISFHTHFYQNCSINQCTRKILAKSDLTCPSMTFEVILRFMKNYISFKSVFLNKKLTLCDLLGHTLFDEKIVYS